jgi:hypothetical protein
MTEGCKPLLELLRPCMPLIRLPQNNSSSVKDLLHILGLLNYLSTLLYSNHCGYHWYTHRIMLDLL